MTIRNRRTPEGFFKAVYRVSGFDNHRYGRSTRRDPQHAFRTGEREAGHFS